MSKQKAQYGFNFQPFTLPTPIDTTGGFSQLQEQLVKRYDEGELITEQAKEILGTMDVDSQDQETRNSLAAEFDDDIGAMLQDYDGAYESKQFQRSAKQLIRKYVADPRIIAMKDTLEAKSWERQWLREAKAAGKEVWDFNPSVPQGSWQDANGEWHSYQGAKEMALDHLSDAKRFVDKLQADLTTLDPKVAQMVTSAGNVNLFITGQVGGISEQKLKEHVDLIVDEFAFSTTGGNQLARMVAMQNGYKDGPFKADGTLEPRVRDYLVNYLQMAGNNQLHSKVAKDFTIPDALNPKVEEDKNLVTSNQFTREQLNNNPYVKNMRKLTADLKGGGLKGQVADELANLHLRRAQARNQFPGVEPVGELTPEEEERYQRLRQLDQQNVDTYAGLIDTYRKSDGKLDIETLNEDHMGLWNVYTQFLEDQGMGELIKPIENGTHRYDPRLFKAFDDAIETRYNSFIDNHAVTNQLAGTINEGDIKAFDEVAVGKSKSGIGSLEGAELIDAETGESTTFRKVMDQEIINKKDAQEMEAFKGSINLQSKLLPIFDSATALITIKGKRYKVVDKIIQERMMADGFSYAKDVALGKINESAPVTIPGLGITGKWEANHAWDDNNQYRGDNIIFRHADGSWSSLQDVATLYLESNSIL